jgi:hypothetical protein
MPCCLVEVQLHFRGTDCSLSSGPQTKPGKQASSLAYISTLKMETALHLRWCWTSPRLHRVTSKTWYSPVQCFVKHKKKIISSWSHLSRRQKVNHYSQRPTFQDMRILEYDITDILSWWQIENYPYMPRSKTCEGCFTFTVKKKSSSYLVHWHSDIMCVDPAYFPVVSEIQRSQNMNTDQYLLGDDMLLQNMPVWLVM